MENTEIKRERAVLAGLSAASMDESERSTEISMEELAALGRYRRRRHGGHNNAEPPDARSAQLHRRRQGARDEGAYRNERLRPSGVRQ